MVTQNRWWRRMVVGLAGGCAALLVGCLGGEAPPAPETLGGMLERVTGGHTRAVWIWHQAKKKDGSFSNDTYGNGNSHVLMGIDSRDGLGVRPLLEKTDNYARPLLSPDGQTVVFTDKDVTRKKGVKHFAPFIYALPWGAPREEIRKVGKGHAVDVWADPADGVVYVYAVDNLRPTPHSAVGGKRLQRYRLDGAGGREILFEEEISLDNFQLGRDGRTAAGQFPWPNGGVMDLRTGEWSRRGQGCWTSIAPDDSGVMWVFDGAHRNLRMAGPRGEVTWTTPVDNHPDFGGLEVYHPRWGNHPRILAVTGPYGTDKNGGNQISKGGNEAEVFIGRFSGDLRSVEDWVRLTDNGTGDYYPDVWVAGGGAVSLDEELLGIAGAEQVAEADAPSSGEVVFRWENAKEDNRVGDGRTTVLPDGTARFGYDFGMVLDGGRFLSERDWALQVAGSEAWTLSFVLEEAAPPGRPSVLLRGGARVVARVPEGLWLVDQGVLLPLAGGGRRAVTVVFTPVRVIVWVDGDPVDPVPFTGELALGETAAPAVFGSSEVWSPGYRARLSHVLVARGVGAPLALPEPAGPRPPRIRLRATLIEKQPTPPAVERDTYVRSLVHFTYRVEEVLEGDLPDGEVAVWHWVVLDGQETTGLPDTPGDTYELTIELAEEPYHRQLAGELSTQPFSDVYLDARIPEL